MEVTLEYLRCGIARMNYFDQTTDDTAYTLESEHGKWRILSHHTSKIVSPLLSKSALYDWIWAWCDGSHAGYNQGYARGLEEGRGVGYDQGYTQGTADHREPVA
jgi:flagellar biosynthesis/type III secretory pathway protein FliH